jgi:hypothetical protein
VFQQQIFEGPDTDVETGANPNTWNQSLQNMV